LETETPSLNTNQYVAILGPLAGFCTTFAFVPQVIKIWNQGGRDLSYGMLFLYLTGVLLWFFYGLLIQAPAVVWTNIIAAVLIAIATILKTWTARRDTSI